MNILQITDLHIAIPDTNPFDVNCIAAFEKTLKEGLSRYDIDWVVLSGDLCQDKPDPAVYNYVKDIMYATQKPFYIISGNHDHPALINQYIFDKQNDEKLYFSTKIEEQTMLFLDTTTGYLSSDQWYWLEDELKTCSEKTVIFMHHPPSLAHVPHMDINYSFKENDIFTQLLKKHNHIDFYIFCGHYHNERTIIDDNLHIFITPSTYMQISDETPSIKVYHTKPAYRIIHLNDQKLTTFVNYMH